MRKSKQFLAAAIVACLTISMNAVALADGEPASLDADTVEYDMGTGVITATDNVLMKRGTERIAGQKAVYNSKTQAGTVTGNVIAMKDDMRLTCNEIVSDGQEHMRATGNVHGTQQDKSFSGNQVDYYRITTQGDRVLVRLMWVYDINFAWTLKKVVEKGYIDKVVAHLPVEEQPGLKPGFDRLYEYIEAKCKTKDAADIY